MIYIFIAVMVVESVVIAFLIYRLLRRAKLYSGILHIKQTEDKDYYTIEITDDFYELSDKKEVLLKIHTSR